MEAEKFELGTRTILHLPRKDAERRGIRTDEETFLLFTKYEIERARIRHIKNNAPVKSKLKRIIEILFDE